MTTIWPESHLKRRNKPAILQNKSSLAFFKMSTRRGPLPPQPTQLSVSIPPFGKIHLAHSGDHQSKFQQSIEIETRILQGLRLQDNEPTKGRMRPKAMGARCPLRMHMSSVPGFVFALGCGSR